MAQEYSQEIEVLQPGGEDRLAGGAGSAGGRGVGSGGGEGLGRRWSMHILTFAFLIFVAIHSASSASMYLYVSFPHTPAPGSVTCKQK